MQFQVKLPETLLQRLTSRDTLGKITRKMMYDLGLLAQLTARREAPKDTGTLRRSIMLQATPVMARVSTPLVYAPVMEFGRRPGAKMPPPRVLLGWARRHGFGIDSGTLFVIARAIGRRGLKGHFYMQKASAAVRAALPGRVKLAEDEIRKELSR